MLLQSCNNVVLTITTALYAGSVYHEGYIVSVHRMVMENRPVVKELWSRHVRSHTKTKNPAVQRGGECSKALVGDGLTFCK